MGNNIQIEVNENEAKIKWKYKVLQLVKKRKLKNGEPDVTNQIPFPEKLKECYNLKKGDAIYFYKYNDKVTLSIEKPNDIPSRKIKILKSTASVISIPKTYFRKIKKGSYIQYDWNLSKKDPTTDTYGLLTISVAEGD